MFNRTSYVKCEWSNQLLQLEWLWEDIRLSYEGQVYCPWLQLQKKKNANGLLRTQPKEDECCVILGERKFSLSKSIISSKSAKLDAAIRFAEMNNDESESTTTEIELDVPFDIMKLFVQHCYHGSFVYGLSSNLELCCQQLMDLYVLAQEYLCPSLMEECEMRMLSSDPYECICWSCCTKVDFEPPEEAMPKCIYTMKGPSRLLIANNLLCIISYMDEIEQTESCYKIYFRDEDKLETACKPLEAITTVVWASMMYNFNTVLKSDSYLSIFQSTMHEYVVDRLSDELECFGDEIAVLLLQNCLDSLVVK